MRPGSLLPLLATAASIVINKRRQTPLPHTNLAKKLARTTDFLAARVRYLERPIEPSGFMLLVRSGFQVKAVHRRSRNELAIEHFPIPTLTVGSYPPPEPFWPAFYSETRPLTGILGLVVVQRLTGRCFHKLSCRAWRSRASSRKFDCYLCSISTAISIPSPCTMASEEELCRFTNEPGM